MFGPTGYLTNAIIPAQLRPTAIADSFDTPHTLGYNIGVQRELTDRHGDRGGLLSPRHPQPARSSKRQHRLRIARARPPVPGALYDGTDSDLRSVLRRAVRRAGHQLQQALQPPLHDGRQLHLRAGHRQFARDQFGAVGQLRRHGPAGHRNGDRPIERQWRIHARQRDARAGGRHVPERTRSRQGTVRSGDRSRAPGQRHGRTAVPDSGQRHLPGAERLPLQPGSRRAACWSIPTAMRR